MANEIVVFPSNAQDMYYEFEGSGGLSGYGRFNVGYSWNISRKLKGALRFQNIQIPQGSSINTAGVEMYMQEKVGDKEIFVKIWGMDEDNTASFSSNPLGRTKTSASNTHHSESKDDGDYFGIGVGGILQEVVGRGGWSSGNAFGVIVEDDGTSTSESGGYLYDHFVDSPNSYLSYRISAEPNFKPTPKEVAAPTFPATNSYGMKISYPGYDVDTATEDQTYFTTRKRCMKVVAQGKINTTGGVVYNIAHGQSVKPFARAWFKSISSGKRYQIPRVIPGEYQDPDADTTNAQIEIDGTNVKIRTDDSTEVYYYIYIDELKA